MTTLESVLADGVGGGLTAGAVAAISVGGVVRDLVAVGVADRRGSVPMSTDTLFDIASLTKVAGTTTALMTLAGRGDLDPGDPLTRFLPFPIPALTLVDLLTHRSGLLPWQPLYFAADDPASAVELIRGLPVAGPVGGARRYSDLGFILLGAVLQAVTGTDLRSAVGELVTRPLGLRHTDFRPAGTSAPDGEVAATSPGDVIEQRMTATGEPYPVLVADAGFDRWRTRVLRGEVSDCNAFHAFGGVAGHAGLFSTAADLLAIVHGLLGAADFPAPAAVLDQFLCPGPDQQALGWWTRDLPDGIAYWHSGFTGTRLLFQPATGTAVVLLTNRLHALVDGNGGSSGDLPPDIAPLWDRTLRAAGLV